MGVEDSEGAGGAENGPRAAEGHQRPEQEVVADAARWLNAAQSPVYHAEHADRYERQALIAAYEQLFDCRLVVLIDDIFWWSVTLFEELLYNANPAQDLHLLLDTQGGDGEVAIRLARAAQSRCRHLTVIVPHQAKSAGTVLALGADQILMGPTSDLGPIDPQLRIAGREDLVAAKDLVEAVNNGIDKVQNAPDTFPLVASLLADVDLVTYQKAVSAIAHTDRLLHNAVAANPNRSSDEIEALCAALDDALVKQPLDHGAVFGFTEAQAAGLPVRAVAPGSDQWQLIWRLWSKYFSLRTKATAGWPRIYEGGLASQIIWPQ